MKILFVGDSPTVNTGFGVVSKNVLAQLHAKGHQIAVLGVNHHGEPYSREDFPYDIHPCEGGGGSEGVFGMNRLWHILPQVQPDLLFLFNDPWIIRSYLEHRPDNISAPYLKIIGYYPIDAGPMKSDTARLLSKELDAQVCYSHYAERIITEANDGKRPDNLYQVYHGVDTKIYRPLNQQAVREELGISLDSWVVGMVARNQYRKRFDILMSAFAKFAKDKDDARLYLHTVLSDVGYDINDLIKQFKIGGKVILTQGMDSPAKGVPDTALNLIYNSFDVNALISLGDGFGLPVAESMAVGCPQIVSDHSCLKELVEGHGGITVKNAAWLLHTAGINTWGGVTDEDDLVAKLEWAYSHRDIMRKYGEEGYKFIMKDQFSWNEIGNKFDSIIKNLFHTIN